MDENPYAPPTTFEPPPVPAPVSDNRYRGIGGWLLLVLLGLVITPFRAFGMVITTHLPIFTSGRFNELIDPASPDYHPLWAVLLPFEVLFNVLVGSAAIVGLVLMFRRSRAFPKWMIGFYLFSAGFVIADLIVAQLIPAVAAQDMSEAAGETIRALVAAAIWVPYMRVSKRVKATFVE
jgi:hypothetical protein